MNAMRAGFFATVIAFAPFVAGAWDQAGHMLVDQIAWEQMKPAARARAAELVKSLDSRFNEGQPYNFVTAGAWMDDMRGLGRDYQWAKLHYIDIPWTENGVPTEIPEGPSVLTGIADSLKTLRDPQATPAQRTEALGMLAHFVGDIHQPLHTTERNHDRGGNTYLIAGVPFSDLRTKQGKNLHTFWDKAFRFDGVDDKIVETWTAPDVSERPKAPGEGAIAEQAKKIKAEFPREKLPELAGPVDALAWAKETYAVGCKSAYPPGDPPENVEVRELTPEFVHEAHEVANRRIALAGYRLGALLNALLAP
jgi:hypothetical protein